MNFITCNANKKTDQYYRNIHGLVFVLVLLNFALPKLSAQYISHPPEPWQPEYDITLKGFEFTHPMTVISADELAIIKQRILYNAEPQSRAFEDLLEDADAALEFQPYTPQTLEIPGGYVDSDGLAYARTVLWDNCHAAYSCAMVYAITGNPVYAEKATGVLMYWSDRGIRFTGDDSGLQLGSYFSPMLYAADLLHDYTGWEEADRSSFKSWWRNNCLEDGQVLNVLRNKDNNWKDAALLGTFAAAVVLEDTVLLKEALIQLTSYFYGRTDSNVRLPGDAWKIAVDNNGVYLPREVVRNDGSSGITYTAYALTTMVQAMEIARYSGFDFWQRETVLGATIGDVIEQYYRWNEMNEPFPWNWSANKSDKRRNPYEIANIHYTFQDGFKEYLENNRPLSGREGDEYTTLTKGDMTGTDTLPVAAPSDLSATTLSSTKTELTWTDNSNNEYGFKIERSAGQEFILIDSCGPGDGFYSDTGLVSGTIYTYRVYGFNMSDELHYSNEAETTTQDYPAGPPAIPAAFSAKAISSDQIGLTWQNNADNEEGYVLERKEGETFTEIAELWVNDTVFNDMELEPYTTYTYRIRSYNIAGSSGYSEEASATTLTNGGKFQSDAGILSMEAEFGELGLVWTTGEDETASGGAYLEVNPTRDNSDDRPECDLPLCLTTYFFTIHEAGDYSLWFRTISEGEDNDSFFWRIGTAPWVLENGRSGTGSWHKTTNEQLSFAVGDYVLEINYRENGTRIDKFVIQPDSGSAPEGKGPLQSVGTFPLPPKKPASLSAVAMSDTEIRLRWTDYATDEDGYVVERDENGGFIEIAQLGAGTNTYSDTGLTENTKYTYRVYAYNGSGRSNFSNTDTVSTLPVTTITMHEAQDASFICYPNPFSEKTTIRFWLHRPQEVMLEIYDITGQRMMLKVARFAVSGWHSMEWDGAKNTGEKAASGVYFCRLKSEKAIKMFTLVLQK